MSSNYYNARRRRRGKSSTNLSFRQGGTGSTYSGSQDIIRHSNTMSGTIPTGYIKTLPLVCYNPDKATTPYSVDGSSAKVRYSNFCDLGSRVDYVTVQLTLNQSDTSKNNTCYVGTMSTSFNEARLDATLMADQFGNGTKPLIVDEGDGEMNVQTENTPPTTDDGAIQLTLTQYAVKDILQHNLRYLTRPQFQLYSGRVITANQVIPVPRKNKRQQEGSLFAMAIMNDSTVGANVGTDVEYRLDTFFKEIPSTTVS